MNTAEWKNLIAKGGIVNGNVWYPSQSYIDGEELAKGDRRALLGKEEAQSIKRYLRPGDGAACRLQECVASGRDIPELSCMERASAHV